MRRPVRRRLCRSSSRSIPGVVCSATASSRLGRSTLRRNGIWFGRMDQRRRGDRRRGHTRYVCLYPEGGLDEIVRSTMWHSTLEWRKSFSMRMYARDVYVITRRGGRRPRIVGKEFLTNAKADKRRSGDQPAAGNMHMQPLHCTGHHLCSFCHSVLLRGIYAFHRQLTNSQYDN